jgi:hypothetical protein
VFKTIDRHWPWVLIPFFGGGMALGYSLAAVTSKNPVLIGRLDSTTRGIFYGSIAGSAGALLGLIIASLAILLTLDPSRPTVAEMQRIPAWRILNVTLLVAAACMGITLGLATIALGVDSGEAPNESIEVAVAAMAALAFSELAVGGLAFAVVVLNLARRTRTT